MGPESAGRAPRRSWPILALSLVALILLALVCLAWGRLWVPLDHIAGILAQGMGFGGPGAWPDFEPAVILNVRLPRVLLALAIGAGLALAGAAFQGLFANPLATPDTLGVGAGAAFGAALGILVTSDFFLVQVVSVAMGLAAMGVTYLISRVKERRSILMVVLAGVVTGAFFQALIALVKYVADPETKLPAITFWLMGSLATGSYSALWTAAPFLGAGMVIIVLLRWRLNVLSLSDDEAASLGVRVARVRWLVILASTMVTAAAVSLCGQIGWVGLVVPHAARMLVGSDHRTMVPLAALLGAGYLLVVDTLARTATSAEIPLSILTALLGAPFFAALLRRNGGGTWN